ncbi:MAG: DNA polymerase III subunit delta [Candidatus Pacebacteria bacterium]|nr:DNA polymerase III subunit delta [Candidatus Paceibacterota bacterium]MDR3583235.1 DNA polymerase III subunit delta [Candidatus Paceibacterota bacterium]
MIIFLYGDDRFRSHQKLLEIKQKYLESDKSGSGLSRFDFSEGTEARKIINVFSTPNLLAPKRLVIIKRMILAAPETEKEKMREYFKKNGEKLAKDNDLVVSFWEDGSPKKADKLFKILEKISKSQEYVKLFGAKLDQWILKRIKELDEKSNISKAALERLIAYCGGDSLVLNSEIEKLVNYASGEMIGEKDVELLVRANVDSNIFATVDALGANNKKEALKLLHRHLEKGDDPFYLMSMFVYQFRNLLKIADLKEQGMPEYEIVKNSKLHPFVVKKSLGQLCNYSFARLKKIYAALSDIDAKVKIGKIDMKLALDKFVAEL